MNRYTGILIGLSLVVLSGSIVAEAAAEAREGDSEQRRRFAPPIRSVIVYPDRVLVSREAAVQLLPGRQILVFSEASSALDPSSLRGYSDSNDIVVQSVSTYVERQAETRNEELRALEEKKKLEQERSREEASVERSRLDQQGLNRYRDYLTETISRGSVDRQENTARWTDSMKFVASRSLESRKQELKSQERMEQIDEELGILQKSMDRIRSDGQKSRRTIEITVQSTKPVEATIGFSYHMRGASWSVSYGFHNQANGETLVEYYGNVRQQTGEDWKDVEVRLSTSTPSYGAERPGLRSVYAGARDARLRETIQEAETKVADREEGEGPGSEADTGGYASVEENTGSPVFLIPRRATLPSAERSFRLTIARFTLKPVEAIYRIVGSEQRSAHYAIKMRNDRPFPLLAGPADSYRMSGFTGRGQIAFTPSGGTFTVGFGVDRNVKLKRNVERFRESALFSGKIFRTAIDLEIGNEGGVSREVQVFERIPVSEVESVKVRLLPETSTGYTEEGEKTGILKWQMKLNSGERRKIRLSFEVETPGDFPGEIYGK